MADDIVREIYTKYPYPPPVGQEDKPILPVRVENVPYINSVFWGGKKRPDKSFRVLDAGCGTGDSTIYLADQLKGTGAEVIGLDFSQTAIDFAKKVAQKKGVDNALFVHGSLLELPSLDNGKFDFILCNAVLPHLDNPEEGLKVLSGALKDDGGLGLKIYAKYGRMPIQIFQELCIRINSGEEDLEKRLGNAREAFKVLPPYHWVRSLHGYRELAYDSVLSAHTKAYTVPEVYKFLDSGGLRMARFIDELQYNPSYYAEGKFEWVGKLPKPERQALGELFNSRILFHQFFATKSDYEPPAIDPSDEGLIPIYTVVMPEIGEDGLMTFNIKSEAFVMKFRGKKEHSRIFTLVDGKRSVREIIDLAAAESGTSPDEFRKTWKALFPIANQIGAMCLSLP